MGTAATKHTSKQEKTSVTRSLNPKLWDKNIGISTKKTLYKSILETVIALVMQMLESEQSLSNRKIAAGESVGNLDYKFENEISFSYLTPLLKNG